MLSRADADLIGRDGALVGLKTLLDQDAFEQELGALGLRGLKSAVPDYVRYKPATSCLVGYSVQVGDRTTRVHATTYGECVGEKAAKARSRALGNLEGGALLGPLLDEGGCVYSDAAHALISFYPFDPDLPAMKRVQDPNLQRSLLARVFRDLPVPPTGEIVPLAYKPGRRFVARLRRPEGDDFVLRCYATAAQERANRFGHSLRNGDTLRIPRRVGGSKRHMMATVEWLPGLNLRTSVRATEGAKKDVLERVARALVELHESRPRITGTVQSRPPAAGLPQVTRGIAWLRPSEASLARTLQGRIASAMDEIRIRSCVIHGDLYDKQIVLTDGGVGLVDLDDVGLGDPRQDVGLMLAHWELDRLSGNGSDGADELGSALIDSYRECGGGPLDDLNVFTAASLFSLVQHPFRNRVEDWPSHVTATLSRVRELLDGR